VYGNRRRIRGEHGKEPLRRCGGLLERSFAHAYETGWRAARALAGAEEQSQARADAGTFGGCSADFIAVLDSGSGSHRTGMNIGHDARAPRAHGSSYPARSTVSNHFCHGL
jgi:hypothetical protein